jgi:phage shock protein E
MNDKKILLDVRSPAEFQDEHIDGSVNFEIDKLMNGELPEISKDSEIIVYCASGGRAGIATQILKNAGFLNVENMGGINNVKSKLGLK